MPDWGACIEWRLLATFIVGYGAILAVPGPNLLAIGTLAALRGLRGAGPFCLGAALGAGALGGAIFGVLGFADNGIEMWTSTCRLIGAALLLSVALSVVRLEPPRVELATLQTAKGRHRATMATVFGAGFLTALTNPITAAFFGGQFLGPLSGAGCSHTVSAALSCAVVVAFGFYTVMAAVLAIPAARSAAAAWHRPLRLTAAATLLFMAGTTIRPLISF